MTEKEGFLMEKEKSYTPLLPYDATYGEYFSTYDNVCYVCNRDVCHNNIGMNSGNIVKYYSVKMVDSNEEDTDE